MKVWLIGFSSRGCALCEKIASALADSECRVFSKTSADAGASEKVGNMHEWTSDAFDDADAIVFVGAVGIAVRHIAPFIKSKTTDPAVVDVDERGTFAIPLLSGHIGGANDLARGIASEIGATPVITTATDINGKFSVDSFATANRMWMSSMVLAKDVSSRVLDGRFVGLHSDFNIAGRVPRELTPASSGELGVDITITDSKGPFDRTLKLVPKCCVVGIGCRKGISKEKIRDAVNSVLAEADISPRSVRAAASIDIKSDEKGLLDYCSENGIGITFFSSSELNALPGEFTRSDFVRSVTGVDCVCERSAVIASRNGHLIVNKTVADGVTVAVALDEIKIDFGADTA